MMFEKVVPRGRIALPVPLFYTKNPWCRHRCTQVFFWWIQNADARGKQMEVLVKYVGDVVWRTHTSKLRCGAIDRRSRVNDVAKNAGQDIMQSREKESKADSGNGVLTKRECGRLGSGIAFGKVRDCGGGAGCMLGCVLALAFGCR
jgi:hypothetical protein